EVTLAHQRHGDGHEHSEQHDNRIDRELERDQERIEPQHHQDREVLVEILHRDRMARAHENVAAVLQERVHGHHEKTGERADQHHERDGYDDVAHEDHHDHDDAHRYAYRHHACRPVQRHV